MVGRKSMGNGFFMRIINQSKIGKKLRVSGIYLINMESWPAILLLMTMLFKLVEQW